MGMFGAIDFEIAANIAGTIKATAPPFPPPVCNAGWMIAYHEAYTDGATAMRESIVKALLDRAAAE